MREIEHFFYDYLEYSLAFDNFYKVFTKDYLFYIQSNDGGIMSSQVDNRTVIPAFLTEQQCDHYTKYFYSHYKLQGDLFIDVAPYGYDLLLHGDDEKTMLVSCKILEEILRMSL
jgi:hypothetical protein